MYVCLCLCNEIGLYSAQVWITDSDGEFDDVVIMPDILVYEPPIITTSQWDGDTEIAIGDNATVLIVFSGSDYGDSHSMDIDWGDGTVTNGVTTDVIPHSNISQWHTYTQTGLYTNIL